VNYTLPANYTTNKVTTSGVNQKYWWNYRNKKWYDKYLL
jgi:hypothetical protein